MKTSLYLTSFFLFALINPFFSQQISTLDGRFLSQNGELLEGSFETFYETGQLHESFQLINGIQQGDFVSYTWPDLIYQASQMAKSSFMKGFSINSLLIFMVVYAVAIFATVRAFIN